LLSASFSRHRDFGLWTRRYIVLQTIAIFAVCAFDETILPVFSSFITEKKLRKLQKTGKNVPFFVFFQLFSKKLS